MATHAPAARRLLTARETAELLTLKVEHVYSLSRDGALPCVRAGRRLLFDRAKLLEWLETGGSPLAGGWRRAPEATDRKSVVGPPRPLGTLP